MPNLELPRTSRWWTAARYGAAVAVVVVATLVTATAHQYLVRATFLFYFGAVTVAAVMGGRGPGVLAAVLSALVADYYFIDPVGSFSPLHPTDLVAVAAFAAMALFVGSLTGSLRAARTVAESNARAAEALAVQLQEQAVELEASNEQLQEQAAELEQQTEASQEAASAAEAARAEAEAANAAKAQFLGALHHEYRTPLNAITGYVDLLEMGLRGPLTDAQREDLARIRRASQVLLSLVNDVLNFSRLEAGAVELRIEDVRLDAVLREVEDLVRPQLAGRGLAYEHDACGTELCVRADPERLRIVLLNLLTNAIKFTDPGGRIALHCTESEGAVRLQMRDTGRGIPREKLASIFDPFVQIDRHLTTASQQGVGLGLAISRDLARLMGGDLTVESEVGAGSTFTLTLQAGTGTAIPQTVPSETGGTVAPRGSVAP